MTVESKLAPIRKGLLEFLVLKIVGAESMYVPDILRRLAGTEFSTQEGTLYPLLSKLRREDLVQYEWKESDQGPPRKYYRLSPGREVRLYAAYLVTATHCVKDATTGEVVEVHATYDPATRGGSAPDGRSPKATLHWLSAAHAVDAEVRLYDRLFKVENPAEIPEGGHWLDNLNPDSLEVLKCCKVEPFLKGAAPGDRLQFQRQGYFCADSRDSRPDALVFNRAVSLRDTWARIAKKTGPGR